MARIEIRTLVPANTEVGQARAAAKLTAAEQLNLQVVEESILPVVEKIATVGPNGETILVDSPNDYTVDRELITFWDFHQ